MADKMAVKYRCNQCPIESEVEVPTRSKNVGLMLWLRIVGQAVANDHLRLTGQNHKSCDLAIPYSTTGSEEPQMLGNPPDEVIEKTRGGHFPGSTKGGDSDV